VKHPESWIVKVIGTSIVEVKTTEWARDSSHESEAQKWKD
jgi:hypothetical protein